MFGSDPTREICLDLLRRSANPLLSGDFEGFAACFRLPQTITTPNGLRLLRNRNDLEDLFHQVRAYFADQKIKMITRECVKSEFAGEATIMSVHESRLITPGGIISPPYQVFSIIERHAEGWHVTFSDYAVGDSLDHCLALSSAGLEPGIPAPQCEKIAQRYRR